MASHTSSRTELREPLLTPRQAQVLSALVGAYIGEAVAVASETVAALLPVRLSPASVRNTLAELHELGLLDQPEFRDPERIRGLLHALEEKERLVDVVTRMLESGGPRVAFGADLGEPALAHLAVVAAPFGRSQGGVGSVGVIGPSRMDYARVIPLVGYVSRLLSEARHA
jgi:transcriptional regulator of heat shock response